MASILQQIDILQARFSSRKNVKFCSHYIEATATQSATIAPCCQCARTVLRSSVIACATRNGISGVIEYFTKSFTWGCYPCKYYCECFRHSDELFCTATMCIGLEALNIYRQHVKASVSFDLATVELIIIQPKDVINSSKIDIADSRSAHPNKSISSEWLLEDTMYHNLVGIVDRNMQLTACDFDSEFILNDSGINCQARIAAIRVCPWTGGDTSRSFLSSTNTPAAVGKTVAWSGLTIPLGRWFNIPAANFDRDDALKASLGSVYSNLALQPEPHLVDSCGPAMVNAGTFASSHISTDSLNSQCTLEVTLSELPLSTLRPFATLPAKILPTVLISGIHMGTNPCPGVGVARALRATYQDSVRLLALDDAQFSDPVFDALHQVFEMGSTLCSATASSQRQWDTVASLLLEHLRGDRRKEQAAVISQKPSFYMPVKYCSLKVQSVDL